MISDLTSCVCRLPLQCSTSFFHHGSFALSPLHASPFFAPSLLSALLECSGAWWAVSGGHATMEMLSPIQVGASEAFSLHFFSFFFSPSDPISGWGRRNKKIKKAAQIRQRGQMGDRERESVINGFVHNADVRGTDEQEKWPSNEGKE